VIHGGTVRRWGKRHPDAAEALRAWLRTACDANWHALADIRTTYPHADAVEVESGRIVVVFNIRGNRYRLIAAIHYNRQIVYTLKFLTHAEYSKDRWKKTL
jgi:mRNA interferase HigB